MARLVGEVEDIRQMMEIMNRMITGQVLEEERGETGSNGGEVRTCDDDTRQQFDKRKA